MTEKEAVPLLLGRPFFVYFPHENDPFPGSHFPFVCRPDAAGAVPARTEDRRSGQLPAHRTGRIPLRVAGPEMYAPALSQQTRQYDRVRQRSTRAAAVTSRLLRLLR